MQGYCDWIEQKQGFHDRIAEKDGFLFSFLFIVDFGGMFIWAYGFIFCWWISWVNAYVNYNYYLLKPQIAWREEVFITK